MGRHSRRKRKARDYDDLEEKTYVDDSYSARTRSSRGKRNTALVFIAAGLFILIQHHFGFFSLLAMLFLFLGLKKIRNHEQSEGYLFFLLGAVFLIVGHIEAAVVVLLIVLVFYFVRAKKKYRQMHSFLHKSSFIENIRWEKTPWVLHSRSISSFIAEIRMDFSLAIPEERETVIILQGVVGDIDLIVPQGLDLGVSVEAFSFVGQMNIAREKEQGIMNRIRWQSNHFEANEHKVKLIISYIVGDINIRFL